MNGLSSDRFLKEEDRHRDIPRKGSGILFFAEVSGIAVPLNQISYKNTDNSYIYMIAYN
jgi:hypothetical protein